MILAASSSDEMKITAEHLQIADSMVTDLEPDMQFVFSKIGRTDVSLHAERLIQFVHSQPSGCSYMEAYRHVHTQFPSMRDFEDVLSGCTRAGFLRIGQKDGGPWLFKNQALPSTVSSSKPQLYSERAVSGG